jgi:hypothetical protein
MIEEETAGKLDFRAFRHAVERRDADALLGFYSDDAELRIVNGDALEGPAFELRGRAEIQRYLQAGEYQDGTRVLLRTTLELRGGRILRQLDVVERHS